MAERELDLKELLSDPLTAVIEADNRVVSRYYDILHKYAFGYEPIPGTNEGEPKKLQTISFDFINSEGKKQTAEIPLLALLPLPLLHISEASFEFDVEMSINTAEETVGMNPDNEQSSGNLQPTNNLQLRTLSMATPVLLVEAPRATALLRVNLPVAAAPTPASPTSDQASRNTSRSSSSNTNMKITIKMEQSDMPIGLANILQTAADSMLISRTKE